MDESDVERYNYYKNEGKRLAGEGEIEAAIEATEKAYAIHPTERIQRRLEKMKAFLKETQEDVQAEDSGDYNTIVELKNGFQLVRNVHQNLYAYQKEGINWLWGLHKVKKGGVLGDDMGLGKTIQIIGFLSGLFQSNLIKSVLIIMPVSLITNWCTEFLKWTPELRVLTFHSESKSQREKNLVKIQRGAGVLVTSYGMVVSNVDIFRRSQSRNFVWDYIILDEGHKIKNPTKTTKAIHELPAKHRLVLTGTPIQNNLKELWALYDFCHQGTLLGSLPTFRMQYETIITRSREKNATSGEKKLGNMMADSLRQLIAPYFLRRTKQEVLRQQEANQRDKENQDPNTPTASRPSKQMSKLPQKNDLIVWLHLSETQIQIYDDFLKTDQVKSLLMTKKSPLVALTVLKKICDHPRLLSARACLQLGMNGEISQEELEEMLADEDTCSPSIDVGHDLLLKESGKLSVLVELLDRLNQEGHRTLVFSQSRKMLDIINNILLARDFRVLRLDGTIKKLEERQDVVKRFQTTNTYSVMLLTTQVGGVGLTLTAADRVVIYDPSWNPATDAQAVDRAYRIGQNKPVVVYRLITCGTVEEKIYRRQIFKDSITKKTMGAHEDPHRYFTSMELKELFQLDDPRFSSTQRQLNEMHSHERLVYPELDEHLAYLHSLDIFGISDHDLMFQSNQKDPDMEEARAHEDNDFIRTRVEKAKLLLQLESEEAHNENVRSGTFCKDLTNFQKSRAAVQRPVTLPEEVNYSEINISDVEDNECLENDLSNHEDLTEEEIRVLKNLSLRDSNFSKALEISLREADRRKSIKLEPFNSGPSYSGINLDSRGSDEVKPMAIGSSPTRVENSDFDVEILDSWGYDEVKPAAVGSSPTERVIQELSMETKPKVTQEVKPKVTQEIKPKVTQEVKPKVTQEIKPKVTQEVSLDDLDNDQELKLALELSMREAAAHDPPRTSTEPSESDYFTTDDFDFEQAIRMSLKEQEEKERKKSQEEEDFAKAIELSMRTTSLEKEHSATEEEDSEDEEDGEFKRALELSMREVEESPVRRTSTVNFTNISVIDNDFAEALEMSMKEESVKELEPDVSSHYYNSNDKSRKSEILVVDSDLEESESEELPNLDHVAALDPVTPKSFLVSSAARFASSKSRQSCGSSRSTDVIYETDEDCGVSTNLNSSVASHSSVDNSVVFGFSKGFKKRRAPLESSTEEDSDSSTSYLSSCSSGSNKKYKASPKENDLQDSGVPDNVSDSSALFSEDS